MTWTSEGLQVGMFTTLVVWMAYSQYRLYHMQQQAVVERADAIAEVKRTADDLVVKTTAIAESVKRDALETATRLASVTAGQLDGKIDQLLSCFDEAAMQQQEVKSVVENTNAVLHKELESSNIADTTTREQIDAIQEATAGDVPQKPEP